MVIAGLWERVKGANWTFSLDTSGLQRRELKLFFWVVLRTLVQPFHSLKHRFSGFLFLFLLFVPSTSIPSCGTRFR